MKCPFPALIENLVDRTLTGNLIWGYLVDFKDQLFLPDNEYQQLIPTKSFAVEFHGSHLILCEHIIRSGKDGSVYNQASFFIEINNRFELVELPQRELYRLQTVIIGCMMDKDPFNEILYRIMHGG